MKYEIRKMKNSEYAMIKKFLYEAIFRENDEQIIPKSILEQSDLQPYYCNFGSLKDDYCICGVVENKVVGAVWVRCIHGYGMIDDETPELAISLYKEYRGYGIGTAMMKAMLLHLKEAAYKQCSLSVQKENYAKNMYDKLGFRIVKDDETEYLMNIMLAEYGE